MTGLLGLVLTASCFPSSDIPLQNLDFVWSFSLLASTSNYISQYVMNTSSKK
jgi:hypothetical protein